MKDYGTLREDASSQVFRLNRINSVDTTVPNIIRIEFSTEPEIKLENILSI